MIIISFISANSSVAAYMVSFDFMPVISRNWLNDIASSVFCQPIVLRRIAIKTLNVVGLTSAIISSKTIL